MNRRTWIKTSSFAAVFFSSPGLFAETLLQTPAMTEGPFYPDHLPLDKDNDLIVISDSLTPAVGTITHLTGRILDIHGKPIKDADIEIWQCDANGVYLHSRDSLPKAQLQDKNFQGYGKFTTGKSGEYRFRTIKPVPYPGRPAPHIHFKVSKNGREILTSQIFIRGDESNEADGVFHGLDNVLDRELVLADFIPIKDSAAGEHSANFDIVIGKTPQDRDHD